MDNKTIRALINADAIKSVRLICSGGVIYIELDSSSETFKASTTKGRLKTWRTIDSAAKWLKSLGIGKLELIIGNWQPGQATLKLE